MKKTKKTKKMKTKKRKRTKKTKKRKRRRKKKKKCGPGRTRGRDCCQRHDDIIKATPHP